MKQFKLFFLPFSVLLLHACGGPIEQQDQTTSKEDTVSITTPQNETVATPPPASTNPNCDPGAPALDGNSLWIPEKDLSVFIVGGLEGASSNPNRVFKVLKGNNCTQIAREVLPENTEPSFPYYLAKINYNNTHQLVAIQGFDKIYCFDLENMKLIPELNPDYTSEREYVDASSGMIKRVELWEEYLIGYAQDMGSFVFDLSDKSNPQSVMPIAEYQISDSQFSSLFLLKSSKNGQQLVLPTFDFDNDEFAINPMMEKPGDIDATIQESARNNRFIVLKELINNTPKALLIDMEAQKRLPLPNDLRIQGVQDILKWAKKNAG